MDLVHGVAAAVVEAEHRSAAGRDGRVEGVSVHPLLEDEAGADLAGDARAADVGRRVRAVRLDRRVRVARDGAHATEARQRADEIAEGSVEPEHALAAERGDDLGFRHVELFRRVGERDEGVGLPELPEAGREAVGSRQREEPVHRGARRASRAPSPAAPKRPRRPDGSGKRTGARDTPCAAACPPRHTQAAQPAAPSAVASSPGAQRMPT
jgi:hypothetical protein